jgi:hypothetical protein
MELKGPLEYLSLGWLLVSTIVVVFAAVEAGYRVGRHRHRAGVEHEAPVGTIVGAALALLAFVLCCGPTSPRRSGWRSTSSRS